jgi:MFS family permease
MGRWAAGLIVLCMALEPLTCFAEDDAPSIVGYGLQGFGTGAAIGLATGFIATGTKFESGEWKTLLLGTGIGALSGMGVGIVLGAIDAGATPSRLGVGHYVLQDRSYGWALGALAGGTVGALVWLNDGRAKDVLSGMAFGTLIGAGVGLVLGILEGALRKPPPERAEPSKLSLNLGFSPGPGAVPWPYPSLSGRF